MSHVFVSHSSDNRELASDLAAFLEARGVRIWIAPRDVRPGMDYSEQLQLAIESAVAFVVLVTDMANKSPYVRAETEMAFSNHKPLFPVRITDIQPAAGLALFLKIRHWTDAYGPSKGANLDRLARELQTLSGAGGSGAPGRWLSSRTSRSRLAASCGPNRSVQWPRPRNRARPLVGITSWKRTGKSGLPRLKAISISALTCRERLDSSEIRAITAAASSIASCSSSE